MTTPYDVFLQAAEAREKETNTVKFMVSGFPPDSYLEEFNKAERKRQLDVLNRRNGFLNEDASLMTLAGTVLENMTGVDLGVNDGEPREPDCKPYYRTLSKADVEATIRYVFVPPAADARIDEFYEKLLGNNGGNMTGNRRDSDRQIYTINEALRNVGNLLFSHREFTEANDDEKDDKVPVPDASKLKQGVWELFAITSVAFQINWWFITPNYLQEEEEGEAIVGIAKMFSLMWKKALHPSVCSAAGIDEGNRLSFIAMLKGHNDEDWNTDLLSSMDHLYTPEQAEQIEIVFE